MESLKIRSLPPVYRINMGPEHERNLRLVDELISKGVTQENLPDALYEAMKADLVASGAMEEVTMGKTGRPVSEWLTDERMSGAVLAAFGVGRQVAATYAAFAQGR